MGLMWLTGSRVQAQSFTYGVRAGLGLATMKDDLSTKSPLLGVNVGGYVSYHFTETESMLAELFYLQTGLNLTRRGCDYRNVFEKSTDLSIQTGYYHAWYLQLPLLVGFRYELPVRQAGHVLGVFAGPAVSYGLFGSYGERMVHPGSPDRNTNYDIAVDGTKADQRVFNHLNRFDLSAIVGISYEREKFTFSFHIDYGFLATSESDDILRIIEGSAEGNPVFAQIPNGHNTAYMFSVAYQLGKF